MPVSGCAAARRPAVLFLPGARGLLLSAFLGRLSYAVQPVAVLLALREASGGLGLATTLASAHGLVASLGFPVRARLVDRGGRRALLSMTVAALTSFALAGLLLTQEAPLLLVVGVLLLSAATAPPVTSTVRAAWTRLTTQDDAVRAAAFGLDAALEEVAFLLGPAVAALLVVTVGVAVALPVAGVLLALSAAGLLGQLGPPVSAARSPRQRNRSRPGLSRPTWLVCAALTTSSVLQGLATATVLARSGGPGTYGLLLSAEGVASLLGLLLLARTSRGSARQRTALLSIGGVLLALPLVAAPAGPGLVAAVLLLGLPVGALVASGNALVAGQQPGALGQAFAVIVTGQNLGGLAGFAAGGLLAEAGGATVPVLAGVLAAGAVQLFAVPRLLR